MLYQACLMMHSVIQLLHRLRFSNRGEERMGKRTMKEIVGKKYDLVASRERLKMSQQQLAEHLGVAQSSVCRWEVEEMAPKVVQLYLAVLIAQQPAKPTRKSRKAKRVDIRRKLGALTPAEREAMDDAKEATENVNTNTEA
jgi:DNA-binding transcriptional regulator YiaG